MVDEEEPKKQINKDKILFDMEERRVRLKAEGLPVIDLRTPDWVSDPKRFWDEFKTTDQIIVPDRFSDWIIGQDECVSRIRLSLLEWVNKLKSIKKLKEEGAKLNQILKERPGPYVLAVGAPGTGKSLIVKVVAEELESIYEKEGLLGELKDYLLVENKNNKRRPFARTLEAGMGRRVIEAASVRETTKGKKRKLALNLGLGTIMLLGVTFMGYGFQQLVLGLIAGYSFGELFPRLGMTFWLGSMLVTGPLFALIFFNMMGMGGSLFGGNEDSMKIPNLLIDNGPSRKLYVDATGHTDSQLFGDLMWDPYQTGNLGTPFYKRVVAGDIHLSNMKILYMDEIKNLQDWEAIEFLTVMENGEASIKAHGRNISGTAALTGDVSPIPALFFFLAAGNEDILEGNSILNRIPAFRDRFNYGDIIVMNDEVEDTLVNQIKVAQVIADELYRFDFLPMSGEGVKEVVNHMRSVASSRNKLKMTFRFVIKILKKSTQLAWESGASIISKEHVREAIEKYCVSPERQFLDRDLDKRRKTRILYTEGGRIGSINGLSVSGGGTEEEMAGSVGPVDAWVHKIDPKSQQPRFIVTGVTKLKQSQVQDSIKDVQTAIFRVYGVDLINDYYVHIKFRQQSGGAVEGPSAGLAMFMAIASCLGLPTDKERKPFKIRQDVAVTGAMEILEDIPGDVRVSAIGGTNAKILGARSWGIRYVIIPQENYDNNYNPNVKGIRVIGARTVKEYMDLIRFPEGYDPLSDEQPKRLNTRKVQ